MFCFFRGKTGTGRLNRRPAANNVMQTNKLKISILIPCHNEEQSVESCVRSCFRQTRLPDEVVVVNDGSTDNSARILGQFSHAIKMVTILKATGNKSHAQEYGLGFITGDVVITTDADTLLDQNFVAETEKSFQDPEVPPTTTAK